jgi:hypothetical protein
LPWSPDFESSVFFTFEGKGVAALRRGKIATQTKERGNIWKILAAVKHNKTKYSLIFCFANTVVQPSKSCLIHPRVEFSCIRKKKDLSSSLSFSLSCYYKLEEQIEPSVTDSSKGGIFYWMWGENIYYFEGGMGPNFSKYFA